MLTMMHLCQQMKQEQLYLYTFYYGSRVTSAWRLDMLAETQASGVYT